MKDLSQRAEFGRFAEERAAEEMLLRGYIVRERNWRPKNSHLEVDIICQQDDTIIFVEVKARNPEDEDPAEAVDEKKQRRLVRAAEIYLRQQPYDFYYRFDIVTVTGTMEDYVLDHIEDAFLPPPDSPLNRDSRHIYVELKNKHNTMNSASSQKTYMKMQGKLLEDDQAVCYLVEVISKNQRMNLGKLHWTDSRVLTAIYAVCQ